MARPIIGITTYRETASWGQWDVPATLLPATYPQAVTHGGATPVLLPPYGIADDFAGLGIVGAISGDEYKASGNDSLRVIARCHWGIINYDRMVRHA